MRPSFLISIISGLLFLYALILFILEDKNNISDNNFKFISLIIFISIFLGIHSMNHTFEEIYFDFNAFVGKWTPKDKPNDNV
jgi:hypothetical protein